jgi:hypothetical protein
VGFPGVGSGAPQKRRGRSGGITISGDDPRRWSSAARQELAKRCLPPLPGPPTLHALNDGVAAPPPPLAIETTPEH